MPSLVTNSSSPLIWTDSAQRSLLRSKTWIRSLLRWTPKLPPEPKAWLMPVRDADSVKLLVSWFQATTRDVPTAAKLPSDSTRLARPVIGSDWVHALVVVFQL